MGELSDKTNGSESLWLISISKDPISNGYGEYDMELKPGHKVVISGGTPSQQGITEENKTARLHLNTGLVTEDQVTVQYDGDTVTVTRNIDPVVDDPTHLERSKRSVIAMTLGLTKGESYLNNRPMNPGTTQEMCPGDVLSLIDPMNKDPGKNGIHYQLSKEAPVYD